MEAKHKEKVALLHEEMAFSQIMKEVGTSLSTIYRVKNSLKKQNRKEAFSCQNQASQCHQKVD